jgi:hypothetical protein
MRRTFAITALCLGLASGIASAAAASADTGPFLTIETGVHEAAINRIMLLPGGAGVLTVSDDKTARIWSLDHLQPRAVLRPPTGPGDDGALYAAAASAHVIALGGRVHDATGHFGVSIFTEPDLRPIGMISGLPAAVTALSFSPSGDALAVGMQDGAGVEVFDLKTMRVALTDTGYAASVSWIDCDAQGRFAVAAGDGKIRLYSADARPPTVVPVPNGDMPWGVAFSPDGKHLAVGDRQRPAVHMLDLTRMRFERDLDGGVNRGGSFNVVAFSLDGLQLYAAGSYVDLSGQLFVRRWDMRSHAASDIAVARDLVTDLRPTAYGVVFATAEPALGRIDANGHLADAQRARHLDFRDAERSGFRTSADGTVIELPSGGSGPNGESQHILFDVAAHDLRSPDLAPATLARPFAGAGGLAVTEWQNNHAPRVNGRLVELEAAETARSVAVLPSGAAAAIGTDFYLRLETASGELWRTATPAPVRAVNASADGRVIIAGLGDGSVHWYNRAYGEELVALFLDPATGRWVLWTPQGFFDHDHRADGLPDGRTLVGYRFNTPSRRNSEFVEIGQLYPLFFRPDLVGMSLRDDRFARHEIADQYARLGDVRSVLDGGLPPGVVLLAECGDDAAAGATTHCQGTTRADTRNPADKPGVDLQTSAANLRVRYRLDDAGSKVGTAIIRRNDAVIATDLAVDATGDHSRTEETSIALASGLNVIRITPVSSSGAIEGSADSGATLRVYRAASRDVAPPQATATPAQPPPARRHVTLYVLAVGVSHFVHPEFDLTNADSDAGAVADLMKAPDPPVYDEARVNLLVDKAATAANIIAGLQDIADHATPDDLVLIFFAGHGYDIDGKYYFAPSDLGADDPDLIHHLLDPNTHAADPEALDALFRREGLTQDRVLPIIQSIRASRLALILDTCFSATVAVEDSVIQRDLNSTVTNRLGHAAGRFVLSSAFTLAWDAAASDTDPAPAAAGNHGLFTAFLLRALQGEADLDHTGRIDIYKLAMYTKRNVERESANLPSVQQPAYFFAGSDFFELRAMATPIGVSGSPPAAAH